MVARLFNVAGVKGDAGVAIRTVTRLRVVGICPVEDSGRKLRARLKAGVTSHGVHGHANPLGIGVVAGRAVAHGTQVDPNSPFWFGLPREVASSIHPYDDYIRASSLVDAPTPEDDLFAGLRAEANVS